MTLHDKAKSETRIKFYKVATVFFDTKILHIQKGYA